MATRQQYPRAFKPEAVRLVTAQGYNKAEAARNLGLDRRVLARWVKAFQDDESEAFRGPGKLTSEGEERRRRRAEHRRLKMEVDILKQATAFFANESNGDFSSSPKRRRLIR
jgi:transposase